MSCDNLSAEAIQSGARAVATIASQFDELKAGAQRLMQTDHARQRGFFTPSEDQQVRHLLVFYWKSRCALIDVVTSFHARLEAASGQERAAVFLVGFAGALTLVDAARYLRENFHGEYVIREKLNEPEPYFGIPAGVYDMVQESLTRPLHIWHLYHALKFFEEHQAELRAAAIEQPELMPMLGIIDRLLTRLSISKADYAIARLRVRTRQLYNGVQRDLLMRAIYGLQKLAGSIAAHVSTQPFHRPCLPPEIIVELRHMLAPGDVIVTRKEHAITNYFLPGHWPHAALYLGEPDELERRGLHSKPSFSPRWQRIRTCDPVEPKRVLEAMKDGVLIRSLRSPCGTDSVAVLRPRLAPEQIDEALARGVFHEGKCYDFGFDFTRSDRLVCTEVVYRAYEGIGDVRFTLSPKAGRLVLSADDLVKMALREEHFGVEAVYLREADARLLTAAAAREVVERVALS